MNIGKVLLFGVGGFVVALFLLKKWQARMPGAPAVPYSSGTPGATNGSVYFDEHTA